MVPTSDDKQTQGAGASPGMRLKITRVGGLLPIQRTTEISLNSLSGGERAAIEALFSIKPARDADTPTPDAMSYKFELDGPAGHFSITIKGMDIPALLRRLLP
jgi:hypothetical protein